MATGTVTFTETTWPHMKKIKMAWTSTAGGAAADTTTGYYDGKCRWMVTVPGGGGVQPDADWDVVVTDSDSVDVLAAAGVDCSNAATEYHADANLGCVSGSKLTFTISGGGNAKSGTVYLYIMD